MKITGIGTFGELCDYLAVKGGGYTLWIGAGASVALTNGKSPTWAGLVDAIARSHSQLPEDGWGGAEMADRLERLSRALGHATFRRELRTRIVDPIYASDLDEEVFLDQAIIGARASTIVSFNIESLSGMVFAIGRGGSVPIRPYRKPVYRTRIGGQVNTREGLTTAPVYFPHGLLDHHGSCVMTRSEYDEHRMTMAATVAVNLCMGGDLLILGMSLGDKYLRDAIRENRDSIDRVYWLDRSFGDLSWVEAARVQPVQAEHRRIWSGIAGAHVAASAELQQIREHLREDGIPSLRQRQRYVREETPKQLERLVAEVLADGDRTLLPPLRDYCTDLGIVLPDKLAERLAAAAQGV